MTAELVRGQNHPLSQVRLEVRISAGAPIVVGATIGDEQGRVHGVERVAHPGAPTLPGLEVSRQAAADHRLAVDLGAMPESVHRISVLLALPSGVGGPVRFGALAAPFVAVTGLDGTEVASYRITGLDAESAVVALELYRRHDAWKVRAIGQGYAGGLVELLADQGLPEARHLADVIDEAVSQAHSRAVAPPPPRTPDGDRTRRTASSPAPAQATSPYAAQGPQDTPVPGAPEQAASPVQGDQGTARPSSPYEVQDPQNTPAQVGPPGGPAQADTAAGAPIDYSHPSRRTAAPPPAPPTAPPARSGESARPVAGDATGWSMDERLYNQVWGMFEDLARTVAAYRSAVDFADSRMEQEIDKALADPRSRGGGRGDAAREAARAKQAQLVDQARAALDRDLSQLAAEAEVVEPALPLAYARWDNPVWHGYRVPMEMPMALRVGDLRLPESADLSVPMLVRLPLERGLWIDSGGESVDGSLLDSDELRRLAMDTAVAHAARLLAVHPAGEFAVHVIDPAGSGAPALAPLLRTGVLAGPPAAGAAGVADVLGRLTQRVDLVQMAVRGGAADSLPPDLDTAQQLVIVNDFPHGFDDRAVTQLRYLADEGPAVGVHLMMVADREDAAAYGPLLDPLWRSLMRLTPVPDDHLADPWVGHAWTYEPPVVPQGSQVLQQVLGQVAAARRSWNR
ncbi:TerD family protein [Streptomyces sp. WI04-05B]|uniref:TerD family protein n=1 Tax=Streptomyces TaxID=1883 RepID=UPI0029A68C96|nr:MULTISPECIES: TerD family protein [unclassified Streptomyces]MDX2541196.1 TerD family protein [Streptomyces sp. WI04-05B]MDX2585574.1 TerD family protein [Streptomyces sp. WI04-05A]MDX3751286.1 TerD family protein [Streptomyces sp. AK08-02]